MTMYYGQLLIGFVCGFGTAVCLTVLFKNKDGKNNKNNKDSKCQKE